MVMQAVNALRDHCDLNAIKSARQHLEVLFHKETAHTLTKNQ